MQSESRNTICGIDSCVAKRKRETGVGRRQAAAGVEREKEAKPKRMCK
jgi:hypothetical protein